MIDSRAGEVHPVRPNPKPSSGDSRLKTENPSLPQQCLAECVGTFGLVFAGTGAIMTNATTGALGHVGVAIVFGAVVAAMIYAFGHVSGAHLNPAVTLGFVAGGKVSPGKAVPFIVSQIIGAILATALLRYTHGNVGNLGATLPLAGNWLQCLILETILTMILMLVILGSGLDKRAAGGFAGISIGLTILLEAMCMGPITGASMNPARSFSPALIGGIWQHQWVYWVAPIVGAQIGVIIYRIISPATFSKE